MVVPSTIMKRGSKTVSKLLALALISAVAVVGCSQDTNPISPTEFSAEQSLPGIIQGASVLSSAEIGPLGGTVQAGPATVYVPAGALSETVLITVVGTSGRDVRCELYPHGQTFDVDVTLALVPSNRSHNTILWFNDAASVWQDVGGTVVNGVVTTQLEHFSSYQTALQLQ